MRFEKADALLTLALEMQAARTGLSLEDIQQKLGVGRRTAMRMRDAIRHFANSFEGPRLRRWSATMIGIPIPFDKLSIQSNRSKFL